MSSSTHSPFVRVGSTVVVRNADGTCETYVIVPPEQAEPRAGRISRESPLGRALIGRQVGESVLVRAPGGSLTVTVESIA